MKLINYNYGYTPADTSGTYYRGKIKMTYNEYCKAIKYLLRARLGATYEQLLSKKILKEDLRKSVSVKGNGFHVCVRVTATQKLVDKYNLKGYKRQNYFLHVIPA